jgi:hypothetical protein
MNHTEVYLVSPHLLAEQERLLAAIAAIRSSGKVAPAYCWLVESVETKAARTYRYIKLLRQPPDRKVTSRSLGKPGSKEHRSWEKAIERRQQVAELEQQLRLLDELIERQQKFSPVQESES